MENDIIMFVLRVNSIGDRGLSTIGVTQTEAGGFHGLLWSFGVNSALSCLAKYLNRKSSNNYAWIYFCLFPLKSFEHNFNPEGK